MTDPTPQQKLTHVAATQVSSQPTTMAAAAIPLPAKMELKGDQAANWEFFKAEWADFVIASDLAEKSEVKQVATFKVCLGRDARLVLTNLKLSEDKMKSVKSIVEELDKCFTPKVNVIYERFIFGTASQDEGESIDGFVSRLRKLVSSCNYKALEDEMVRDRLVIGIQNEHTKKLLLSDAELTLVSAIDKCRANELADSQVSAMKSKLEAAVVNKAFGKQQHKKKDASRTSPCKYCGAFHKIGRQYCPAYGKECPKCSKYNHFPSVCGSSKDATKEKSGRPGRRNTRQHVRALDESADESAGEQQFDCEEAFLVEHVDSVGNGRRHKIWSAAITFAVRDGQEKKVECQLDTGATINVIQMGTLCKVLGYQPKLERTTTAIRVFGGGWVKPIGQTTLVAQRDGIDVPLAFQVIKEAPGTERLPILSAATCEKLNLVELKVVNAIEDKSSSQIIIDRFQDVFSGVGRLSGTCKLHVDPACSPVKQSPRRVPVPLRPELKAKLDELLKQGIIAKEVGPTEWTSNLVIVKTPKKLRLCIDPFHLNKALKRSEFETPTFEDITPELTKARFFSLMDTKDGFWNVVLDEKSSKLTTFWTPFGRFRWLRLPFGLKVSGDEYQRRLHEIFGGIKNIVIVQDDILVLGVGDNDEEATATHDRALKHLLEQARLANIRFNKQKLRLKMREICYMGHLITNTGIKPDPNKVRSIAQMRYPENAQEIKSFLGLATYLAKFVPNLAKITEPLRQLVRKDVLWKFGPEEKQAVDTIKKMISSAPILAYFDPQKEVVLQVDSSSHGVGGALMQDGRPVAFASRSLSSSERNWANIERECLAILFACERFSNFLIGGKKITAHTDHKPLETIFEKPLLKAPVRLQRMMLRLQRYDLTVKYIKGAHMHLADILSRLHEEGGKPSNLEEVLHIQDTIYRELEEIKPTDNANMSQTSLQRIRNETAMDETLCMLSSTIKNGWPDRKEKLSFTLHPYWEHRDELSIQDGVIFKGSQIVVPKSLRADFGKKIHLCHLGLNASIRRARETLFWPFMSSELKEKIRTCRVCQELASDQPKTPMLSHRTPQLPWERVSIDTFEVKNAKYVIMVDSYSDFFELKRLNDITATSLITFCKENFARYGIPTVLVSDNAPQFVGREFSEFSRKWEFAHSTSSPMHSKANGKAEAAVKIAKTMLKKCDRDGTDFLAALLEWRNVPTENVDLSPAQRLMARRTRTTLPIHKALLQPEITQGVKESLELKRRRAKLFHDKSARILPQLDVGEEVLVKCQKSGNWSLGEVESKYNPSSYNVRVDGRTFRRNRTWLRPYHTQETSDRQEEAPTVRLSIRPRTPSPVNDQQQSLARRSPVTSPKPQKSPTQQLNPDTAPTASRSTEPPTTGHSSGQPKGKPSTETGAKVTQQPSQQQRGPSSQAAGHPQHTTKAGRAVRAPKRFTFHESPKQSKL